MAMEVGSFAESVLAHIHAMSQTLDKVSAGIEASGISPKPSERADDLQGIEFCLQAAMGALESANLTLAETEKHLRKSMPMALEG